MEWSQVPLKEQQALHKAFLNNPSIKKLDSLANTLLKRGDYIGSLNTKKEINSQWEYVKQQHLNSYDKIIEETVKLSDLNLPQETLNTILENILTIFICCDIIETANMNANDAIKKVDKSYSIDNFLDLVDLIGNVKRKLDYLKSSTGYMDDLYWADSCDKHYDMIMNKSKSIIKKKGDINKWGTNLKKYLSNSI